MNYLQRLTATAALSVAFCLNIQGACFPDCLRPDAACLQSGAGCPELRMPGIPWMLQDYYTLHPTATDANSARLQHADIDFFSHRWPEALNGYRAADIRGLSRPDRSLYSYRMALCLIKTGHYDQARPWVNDIKGSRYEDVRNFYSAYLDYIDGDFNKAYEGFERVTSGIKGLDAGYYMLQILYSRGQYREVTERADRMMMRNPVPELTPEMHRITGLSYFKLGEYDLARISLLNYLDQNRAEPNGEALYALGAIEYDEGNYEKAMEYFTPVTDDRESLAQSAWLYIGQCRMMQGDIQSATMAFEKASEYEVDPDVAQTAMYNYVTALTRGGSVPFSKSAELLESYLSRWHNSPHSREVKEYLATAYFNDHDYEKAIRSVDAIKGTPGRNMLSVKQQALYQQGVQTATNGDVAGSAKWFERAAKMKDTDAALAAQAQLWLGDAYYAGGQYNKALTAYSQFVRSAKSGDNRPLGLYDLAYAQYKLGRYGEAAETFLQAIDAKPRLNKALLNDATIRRADCLYYTGQYTAANTLYDKALDNNAADADYAAYRRAMLKGLTGTARDKVNALSDFIDRYPDSRLLSQALLEKAQTLEGMGDKQQAAECYRRRLAITPDVDLDELISAATANDAAGDAPQQQLDLLERIRRTGGLGADELVDIDLYEANALARMNRDAEADEIYRRLSGNTSALSGAIAAVTLGERHVRNGNFQTAYDEMSEFTDTGTPHTYWLARGFLVLADACNGLGKPALAREYLTSLRDNYPGDESDIRDGIASRLNKYGKKK